ncbi:porin family protein [Kingella negevensis]|uniref:porin family protein n=1 Tax=Kingella negevensis TaxID=1522312 RepID=UPI00117A7201|nr:porin family protein [Kingella negevensis]MDK4680398.1 porin family protein [Kingella negevensis]MDK4685296.1 porin family protein [Kingella negevensis]MDK4690077.1 porin family protein [Kingella negevensis]MDK4692577.1 porin family protein [Kingella negevensis]MDK4697998.1 porin family protein [Kingella negevensis]
MNAIIGAVKYHFNDRHAVRLEGRYARGKAEYTGGAAPSEDEPEGLPYGSIVTKNIPRKSYDIRAIYEYNYPIREGMTAIAEAGLGHRVLRDLSSRKDEDAYDRKNVTTYAHIGAGLNIQLPNQFEFTPKVAYNHGLRGRQYSYSDGKIEMKQPHAKGFELDLSVSKTFENGNKLSFGPFYRGWKVFDSDDASILDEETGKQLQINEPKNRMREVGFKLQYTF